MGRAASARRIATAAVYGGGGLVGVGAAIAGVAVAQAAMAKRHIGPRTEAAPYADGLYGPRHTGTSLRFVFLGDSSAAGLGADSPLATPGALLAQGLVEATDRPVRFVNVATVGACSADLELQVTRALLIRPQVVAIMIGVNDVTHLVRPQTAVRDLEQAVSRLVEVGAEVIVGTCADIGTVKHIAQPLRWIGRRLSRQLAAAQTIAVIEAGGRSVSLADLLGSQFLADPDALFSTDRFHPSSAGYAAIAQVLLPSMLEALGLTPQKERVPDRLLGDELLPIARAAISAADVVGTEVYGARVGGDDRGPHGRWAQVRHRMRHSLPRAQEPEPLAAADERAQ